MISSASGDAYSSRSKEKYMKAYASPQAKEWVSKLTPEQREEAEAKGLLKPLLDSKVSSLSIEALSPKAHPEEDFFLPLEPGDPGYGEIRWSETALSHNQRRLLHDFFCTFANAKVAWACMRYLLGSGTCESHARALGMSKQLFHYYLREVQKRLNIPPMGNQRSEKVRRKYIASNFRRLKAFLTQSGKV